MAGIADSNAKINSDGARHWVEVDGVELTGVTAVDVKYEVGEIVSATITVKNPEINNRAERNKKQTVNVRVTSGGASHIFDVDGK